MCYFYFLRKTNNSRLQMKVWPPLGRCVLLLRQPPSCQRSCYSPKKLRLSRYFHRTAGEAPHPGVWHSFSLIIVAVSNVKPLILWEVIFFSLFNSMLFLTPHVDRRIFFNKQNCGLACGLHLFSLRLDHILFSGIDVHGSQFSSPSFTWKCIILLSSAFFVKTTPPRVTWAPLGPPNLTSQFLHTHSLWITLSVCTLKKDD